jgi:hypothetical protein
MVVTKLGSLPSGVTAAVSIVITATGVTNYGTFTVEGSPNNRDHTLVLTVTDPTALPTTLTVDLECSPDGGTTWGKYATALALVATAALTAKIVLNVVAGLLYRLNPTSFTAGSATGVVVQGTAN